MVIPAEPLDAVIPPVQPLAGPAKVRELSPCAPFEKVMELLASAKLLVRVKVRLAVLFNVKT